MSIFQNPVNNLIMKKERNLLIILTVLFAIYVVLFGFLDGFRKNWFSFFLYFVSVYMLIKAYFFRSDSSLFFSVLFMLSSVALTNNNLQTYSMFQISSVLNIIVSISFFVDFLFFQSKFTFYSFLTNFLLSLPVFLYAFSCINLILMILFLCGAIAILFFVLLLNRYEKI